MSFFFRNRPGSGLHITTIFDFLGRKSEAELRGGRRSAQGKGEAELRRLNGEGPPDGEAGKRGKG